MRNCRLPTSVPPMKHIRIARLRSLVVVVYPLAPHLIRKQFLSCLSVFQTSFAHDCWFRTFAWPSVADSYCVRGLGSRNIQINHVSGDSRSSSAYLESSDVSRNIDIQRPVHARVAGSLRSPIHQSTDDPFSKYEQESVPLKDCSQISAPPD